MCNFIQSFCTYLFNFLVLLSIYFPLIFPPLQVLLHTYKINYFPANTIELFVIFLLWKHDGNFKRSIILLSFTYYHRISHLPIFSTFFVPLFSLFHYLPVYLIFFVSTNYCHLSLISQSLILCLCLSISLSLSYFLPHSLLFSLSLSHSNFLSFCVSLFYISLSLSLFFSLLVSLFLYLTLNIIFAFTIFQLLSILSLLQVYHAIPSNLFTFSHPSSLSLSFYLKG